MYAVTKTLEEYTLCMQFGLTKNIWQEDPQLDFEGASDPYFGSQEQ